MEKISVVIPVYNQEKYLNKSLSSVIEQSYRDVEIVVVNDGSTDSSLNIITEFSIRDNRIRIVNKANGGLVDATIAGIYEATGDYIAFLDPDDYWGNDFLYNLVHNSDAEDIVASGFFYNKLGKFEPYFLAETKEYINDEVDDLRRGFLYDSNVEGIPHSLFFSRWNKIYKRDIVLKACEKFSSCRGISLGEDSIFTYLVLEQANSVKTIRGVNSYYYNIGNQNSMMKSGTIDNYLEKARLAKKILLSFIGERNEECTAYALYFYLIEAIYSRTLNASKDDYYYLRNQLALDGDYSTAVQYIAKSHKSFSKKINVLFRIWLPKGVYWFEKKIFIERLKVRKRLTSDFIASLKASLTKKSTFRYEYKHRRRRSNAFTDLNSKMPIIEKRVYPILQKYIDQSTDLSTAPIEKNIFVFWWDGFDYAPEIVKKCLFSVKKSYSDCRIIEISKHNYKEFTNINKQIEKGFINGKISVQTFSDILRFNLLKNNGGLWIDATIFFNERFPMFENLANKSFESLCFSSSRAFFEYDGVACTWSGYLIASRKNGLFVTAIDKVFEEYYLKYSDYTLYFFIDAVLMLAKKYRIDDGVLDKVQCSSHDMFLLSKLLNVEYDEKCLCEISNVPQKLAWFAKYGEEKNTFYCKILNEMN